MNTTWEPVEKDIVMVEIITLIITLFLARRIESRKDRWTRIILSLMVVFPGTKAFGLFETVHRPDFIGIEEPIAYLTAVAVVLGATGVLGAMWAGPVAEIGTLLLEGLITSNDNRKFPQNRVREACALLKIQNYRQARRMARLCVRENPEDADTRLVAARILLTAGSLRSARWHCWRVLLGRGSSPSQQLCARYLLDQIRATRKPAATPWFWQPSGKIKLN